MESLLNRFEFVQRQRTECISRTDRKIEKLFKDLDFANPETLDAAFSFQFFGDGHGIFFEFGITEEVTINFRSVKIAIGMESIEEYESQQIVGQGMGRKSAASFLGRSKRSSKAVKAVLFLGLGGERTAALAEVVSRESSGGN